MIKFFNQFNLRFLRCHFVFYIDGTAGVAEFEGQVEFGACRHAAAAVVETGNDDVWQRTGCCIIGRILGFFFTLAGMPILAEASPPVVVTLL